MSTGKTLSENGLEEQENLLQITSKLIVNKIAFKLNNNDIDFLVKKFDKAVNE